MNRRFLLRADATPALGIGHVARSTALIEELRARGHDAVAMFGGDPAMLVAGGQRAGAWTADELIAIATDSSVAAVVLDGVAIVDDLAARLVACGVRVMVLDDRGAGVWPVATVVNPNPHAAQIASYPAAARPLLGRRYALLRRELLRHPHGACAPAASPRARLRVVVSFGGSDPPDATSRMLAMLSDDRPLDVTVVVGPGYRHHIALQTAVLRARASGHLATVLTAPPDIARVFASADAAICSAGGTLAELAYLGCPALAYAIVDDQLAPARYQRDQGWIAGGHALWAVDDDALRADLRRFVRDDAARRSQRERALASVDGGGARRVVDALVDTAAA